MGITEEESRKRVRPSMKPGRLLALLASLVACTDRASNDRDLALVPRDRLAVAVPPPSPVTVPDMDRCLPLWPTTLRLSGIVESEERLGPPGYGETPAQDERITAFVLHLPRPVDVCADTSSIAPQPEATAVERIRLVGRIDPERLKRSIGSRMTVDGTLAHRQRGLDLSPVLISVDSLPGDRPPARRSG